MQKSLTITFICLVSLFTLPASAEVKETVFEYFRALETGDDKVIKSTGDVLLEVERSETGLSEQEFYELLIEIGDYRRDNNNLNGALAAYKKAVAYGRGAFGEKAFELRPALQALGIVYAELDDIDQAERTFLESLEIAKASLSEDNPSFREEYDLLALLPIEPLENTSGDDGGDRAGAYRVREIQLKEKAALQRGEIVFMGGDSLQVDQCVGADGQSVENAYERIEVFYGTNREESGRPTPTRFYRNRYDQNADIKYGAVYVSVPCERELGAIPKPKWWRGEISANPAKHMVLEDLRTIEGEDDFWSEVASLMGQSDRKEALVFIHGFNVDFEGAALRTAQLAADLNLDGAPLFYDWPSRGSLFAYSADREVATSQTIISDAAAFLRDVVKRTGAERVNIIAHSMGNEPLLRALEELEDNDFSNETEPPFDEVIFAAPDVNVANFTSFVEETNTLAGRMTLYASKKDKALDISRWKAQFERAGDAKFPVVLDGLDSVDTSLASSNFVGHDDFAGNGLDDLRSVVWFSLPPEKRCVLNMPAQQNDALWIFEPDCKDTVFRAAIVSLRRLGREGALAFADRMIAAATAQSLDAQVENWTRVKAELQRYTE